MRRTRKIAITSLCDTGWPILAQCDATCRETAKAY